MTATWCVPRMRMTRAPDPPSLHRPVAARPDGGAADHAQCVRRRVEVGEPLAPVGIGSPAGASRDQVTASGSYARAVLAWNSSSSPNPHVATGPVRSAYRLSF